MSKGKDISTMFTKEENKKNGRFGYGLSTREKEDVISPAQYGAFLQKRGKRKMSKSVLVIDTPEKCLDCQFCFELDEGVEACCSIADDDKDTRFIKKIDCEYGYCQGKPDWCPLKPLPEKNTTENDMTDYQCGMADGRNQCIDEITGEVK